MKALPWPLSFRSLLAASMASLFLVACTEKTPPPPAPTGLTATAAPGKIALSWEQVATATGYSVKRGVTKGGPYKTVAGTMATQAEDHGIASGETYYYVVVAVHPVGGESANSDEVSITAMGDAKPAAPTNLTAKGGTKQVSLSWDPADRATAYQVFRGLDSGGPYDPIGEPIAATKLDDTELEDATEYFYVVQAENDAGESANSEEASAVTTPPAPLGVTAEGKVGRVELSWDVVPGASSYRVFRSTTPGADYQEANTKPLSETTFTDYPAADGQLVFYVVRAVNDAGDSPDSQEVSARSLSGRELLVSDSATSTVSVFDPAQQDAGPPLRQLGGVTGLQSATALGVSAAGDLFVASVDRTTQESSVVVFAAGSQGDTPPSRRLAGPETKLAGPAAVVVDGSELFVANEADDSVAVYATSASGNAEPMRHLQGETTRLVGPRAIAVDGEELFVLNASSITVYARGAAGEVAPVRVVEGSATALVNPRAIAVDAAADELWVAVQEPDALLVFQASAEGDLAPTRVISGLATQLSSPTGLVIDGAHDEVLVANGTGGAVTVFERNANRNSPPKRILNAGGATSSLRGIVLEPTSGEVIVLDPGAPAIGVWPRDAEGGAAPTREISDALRTFHAPRGLAVDAIAGALFIADEGSFSTVTEPGAIAVFERDAQGTEVKSRRFSSSAVSAPRGLALHAGRRELFVTDPTADLVAAFPLAASDAVTPLRQITGASSGLDGPVAVAVDAVDGELFVANETGGTVTVHAVTGDGDVAPLRRLTDLSRPTGVAFDEVTKQLLVASAGTRSVTVYRRSEAGALTLEQTLPLPADAASPGLAIAVDPDYRELFVASGGIVLVFGRDQAGTYGESLIRTLSASAPALQSLIGITLWR